MTRDRGHRAALERPLGGARGGALGRRRPPRRRRLNVKRPQRGCASLNGVPPALRSGPHRARLRIAMVLAAILLTAIGILGIAGLGDRTPGGVPTVAPAPGGGSDEQGLPDPFAWDPEREDEFVSRAAKGTSHLLYTLSPGGVAESAQRVGRWRRQIEAAAKAADVDPDTLEGLVFLESAGRDDAVTPNGVEGAVGLTQILSGTATDLLGMKVDTRAQRAARAAGSTASARAATRTRSARCAPSGPRPTSASTAPSRSRPPGATSSSPSDTLGREDYAFVSYHMGIGNLQGVLRAFGSELGLARGLLRLQLLPPPGGLRPAAQARRRLLQLLLEGARGAGDHAPVPRRPHGARAPDRAARRQGLRGGGPAPAGLGAAVRRPGRSCAPRGTTGRSSPSPTSRP